MNKILNTILSVLLTLLLIFTIVYAQTGTYTTHGLFYLPKYGASGVTEYNEYNDYMEIADQQIWANKEAIEAIEIPDLDGYVLINDIDSETELETLLTDVTDVYTNNDFDYSDYLLIANKYTDAEAVTAIKADADWNATDWDTALQDITAESIGDLSDVDTTGVADNKILKYDLATTTWVIADDTDTTYTSSDFTHDDLTGYVANEHIDWTTDQGATDIHSGNYTDTNTTYTAGTGLDLTGTVFSLDANIDDLGNVDVTGWATGKVLKFDVSGNLVVGTDEGGSGTTTFVGLTDTPLAYTGYAGYFPKVNAGATALEFAELTESDITDLGTYLTSETDPVFTASDVYSVTTADISNWNTAYGWGDWSGEGFITGVAWGDITGTLSNQTDLNTALGNKLANVSEDTTPELGGDLDMNEKNIVMDSTLTADHSYSGITDVVTVGESVVFGDVLYLDATATEWKKANAAGTGTYPGLVIALETKGDGQACKVLRMGYIRDDSWSWTLGQILLLGETAGALTATVPSDTGDMVQRLGYAIHADKIYFNPSIDVGEI